MYKLFFIFFITLFALFCTQEKNPLKAIQHTNQFIFIDGLEDFIWQKVPWEPINHVWIGNKVDSNDFWGSYKVLWNENYLYVLAKVYDDIIYNNFNNTLKNGYWNNDCLEIFIDEDASGGNHQYSHQAFAYHLTLDGESIDIDTDSNAKYFDHCFFDIDQTGRVLTWEVAIKLYDKNFIYGSNKNQSVRLMNNKIIGFSIAYNDNDASDERENMIGSVPINLKDKNISWINADYFGRIILDGPSFKP